MLKSLSPHFQTGNVYFVTIKGPGNFQKTMPVSKHIDKVAKTYVLVRERNKRTEGYHFHILMKTFKGIHKGWYKKGVHINVKKIIDLPPIRVPFTKEELATMPPFEAVEQKLYEANAESYVTDAMTIAGDEKRSYKKRIEHIKNSLNYMSKDLEFPAQYTDYVYKLRGKNQQIRGPVAL